MFKIGDFSKICQISAKTLRHWDDIGLLKPAQVDRENSYRYYAVDQLYDVNRILALRTMGLSLEQIRSLMKDHVSPEDIRGMFMLKRAEIQQEMENTRLRLQLLEARLSQIDQGIPLPEHEVTLKPAQEEPILSLRECFPTVELFANILLDIHDSYPRQPDWTYFAVFFDEGVQREELDIQVGFMVRSESVPPLVINDRRRMDTGKLPSEALMACTVHRGAWLSLFRGYNVVGRWIADNGYQMTGAGREIFHTLGRNISEEDYVTEIQFPVTKVG